MATITISRTEDLIGQAQERVRQASFGHVIGGVFEDRGDSTLEVLNPATAEVIAEITRGTAADVVRAVAAAQAAFPQWRATTPGARARIFGAIADAVDEQVEELAVLESLNAGKPVIVAAAEIGMIGDIFRFLGGAARALQSPTTGEYVTGHLSMIRREPLGVVGAITPWNYPLLTAVFKAAGAMAAGNTIVLKPSELTPLTTLRFMQIVADILPPGVLNIVLGTGPEVGRAISQHPGIALVSLTGSVRSGQYVIEDSVRSLKPTHLELGGKAPVLIFEDADVDSAVAAIRTAGFWNSGQECGAATRVICAAQIHDAFVEKLVAAVATIKVGSVVDGDDIEMGPLISDRHREMVSALVSRAAAGGARIAAGGVSSDGPGYFFPPTVLTEVARGSEISREEIFGPVVTVETFADEAEAVQLANSVAYGLSASVWTENVGRALRVSSSLDFGTVWVNSHLVLATEMPWGGFKASGHGRELSTLSLEDFSRTKHVMIATGTA